MTVKTKRKPTGITAKRELPVSMTLSRDEFVKKAVSVIVQLNLLTQTLTKKDIGRWRMAWQMAINVIIPRRGELYNIYDDNMVDDHLVGITRQRKLAVMSQPFKIVDNEGTEDTELRDLLHARWFKKFQSLALDSIFYGHSLIEFGDLIEVNGHLRFKNIKLVPRRHVSPEYETIMKNQGDDPKTGIKYMDVFADWCIPVGEPDDLGLLNSVSHQCIAKRNVMAFWDQFSEIFGIPFRIGKTASRDSKDIDLMEAVLDKMGSAGYGLFPEGTDIEIKENAKSDSFNVFDKRIERANSEMSKAILGQTMTTDNGSSKSQGEVHERVAETIMMADCEMLRDVINDDLIPFLIKHGFKFDGYHFEWDDTYEYNPKEMKEIEAMILQYYEVDEQYFIDKYNIKITGTRAAPDPFKSTTQLSAPEKKKSSDLIIRLNSLYVPCPECGGMHLIELANDDVMAESERILRAVFNNELRSGTIDQDLIIAVAEKLKSGVIKGFKNDVAIDFNSPDYRMLLNLKKNVYGFSAAKNYQEILAMNNLLTDENGAVKSFDQFKADAMPLYEIYNTDYLKTEYNLAINGATAASRWVGFEENKEEMPLLMYQTVGDDRVRAEHRVLDRTIRPVGDSFWNVYYPPNGFNCRCTVNQIPQGTATPRADVPLPEIDPMFRVNLAKKNLIFPPDHPYYDGCPKDIVLKGQDLMK